jgi:hypothetical protein
MLLSFISWWDAGPTVLRHPARKWGFHLEQEVNPT